MELSEELKGFVDILREEYGNGDQDKDLVGLMVAAVADVGCFEDVVSKYWEMVVRPQLSDLRRWCEVGRHDEDDDHAFGKFKVCMVGPYLIVSRWSFKEDQTCQLGAVSDIGKAWKEMKQVYS